MNTIAHISDLHFGRVDTPVAEGLVADLGPREPTLLVVSGDFTQRAQPAQYRDAAAFLKRLPGPQLVVPGNHDVPLWNGIARAFFPLTRYRRFVTSDLSPVFQNSNLFVMGVNTARSFTRISGRISTKQIQAVRERACALPDNVFKILVTHHPFIPSPRDPQADVVRSAGIALHELEQCGIDMLLAGHLHLAYHDDVRLHHKASRRSILSVQAGTAISSRRRGEPNAYNWITVSPDLVTVAVRAWNGARFEESLVTRYRRVERIWRREVQVPIDAAASEALRTSEPIRPDTSPPSAAS